MSEHSIEELERQYQSARDRAKQAADDERAAKGRLNDAKLAATGLGGHIVEGPEYSESGRRKRIVVDRIGGYRDEKVAGYMLLKNNTKGQLRAEVLVAFATDLGVFGEA